ncbi:MAG: flagellar motor protein MotB [Planctomycetales bacterium]|nr:flagellar motor protein MotB [Planctomycetales bacterium]
MAGKGGGAWKVAYADFVTAMMAFFLVMWITAQSPKVKKAIAHSFTDPFEPFDGEDEDRGGSPPSSEKNPVKPFSKLPGGGTKRRSKSDDPNDPEAEKTRVLQMRLAEKSGVGTMLFFAEESIDLDQKAKERLDVLIPQLAGKPHKVEIRGHTSRNPPLVKGGFKDPWQMSYARCQSVLKYLVDHGVTPEQVRLSQAGGNEPLTTREDPQGQIRNPRVEVMMLNEWVQDLVGTPKERSQRIKNTP